MTQRVRPSGSPVQSSARAPHVGPPRAAIYARRSTEEHQHASIATQVESAVAFAHARGWTVGETFTDDGISGSEFERRPGLTRMIGAAGAGEFDVLIVRDLDRIGRDTLRVPLIVERLSERGVAVWCYSSGERVHIDDPTAVFLATAVSFARALEVKALRSRTTERLRSLATKGRCVGGEVYGYRRVRTTDGDGVRYEIHEEQAAVVREIFELRAAGQGVRAIARKLNARAVPSPWAGRRGTGSWGIGSVQKIATNERYLGVLTWGRTGSTYRGGTRVALTRPDAEVVRVVNEALRIVPDELWRAAQAKGDIHRQRQGLSKSGGRAKHLLAGLARCGECGGPIRSLHRRRGTVTIRAYGCAWRDERGPTVCTNSIMRPVEVVEGALFEWIRGTLLDDRGVERTLRHLRRLMETATGGAAGRADTTALADELRSVELQMGRLTAALASGAVGVETVAKALAERDAHAKELREALANARAQTAAPTLEWAAVEAGARARLADLRGLANGDVASMREVLGRLLVGPLVFHPVRLGPRQCSFRITGAVVGGRGLIVSPAGNVQTPPMRETPGNTRVGVRIVTGEEKVWDGAGEVGPLGQFGLRELPPEPFDLPA